MALSKTIEKYHLYKYYGCHKTTQGFIFRVYAPNAVKVSVIGDFNDWNTNANIMNNIGEGNFELTINGACVEDRYKYYIVTNDGKKLYKADPYGFYNDLTENKNSRIFDIDSYRWHDKKYIEQRQLLIDKPMNIYEVHLGSWKRHEDGSFYSYFDYSHELIAYVKKLGYTHIELLPITEFPFDGSWGYQVTDYFAPTARFGNPYGFMGLIDAAHEAGIGVIIDWVPAHFCKDEHGLYEFDGTYLYEYSDPLKREHLEWGTREFDYGKPYVQDFLISSAMMFFDKYHVDGIRVDAVASMIYLDYGRKEWRPNQYGNNINLEAVDFMKNLNVAVHGEFPYVLTIAEESTDYAQVTTPVYAGGLGFDYKWNMGWMNDTLGYVQSTMRWAIHHNLSFSMMYAYNENYILPLSHDEVVHGKKSLLDRMPGMYEEKFANLRTYYGFTMTHPGKKLTFMGSEIAQFIEWDYTKGLDWLLLKYPSHHSMLKYFYDLNKFYLAHSELWELDQDPKGFEWVMEDDGRGGYVYKRFNKNRDELMIVLNFAYTGEDNYKIKTEFNYEEVFTSDLAKYGGSGIKNKEIVNENGEITIRVAPLSIIILSRKD